MDGKRFIDMLKNSKLNIKDIMRKAHKLTREIKSEFKNVDYVSQLGICLKFLYSCKSFRQFIGQVGQMFTNKVLQVTKYQIIGGRNAYTLKDNEGNLYRWITNFTINAIIGSKILFKQFMIKANSVIKGQEINVLCKCRI